MSTRRKSISMPEVPLQIQKTQSNKHKYIESVREEKNGFKFMVKVFRETNIDSLHQRFPFSLFRIL